MRTQQEILDKIEKIKDKDIFGFELTIYIKALNFQNARLYLKEDEWVNYKNFPLYKSNQDIKKDMTNYMSFAWEKANNCRGISAYRSIMHYVAWCWLIGEDELAKDIENYNFYGKPQLRKVCDFLGINADQWDDKVRVNSAD